MRNLKIVLVVALGAVLFSSCSRGYGCYYGNLNDQEITPEATHKVIPEECTPQDTYIVTVER